MVNNRKRKNYSPGLHELAMIFKNKKVIIAILVTLGILILFRVGSVIPMPFMRLEVHNESNNSFMQMMNLLGGGGLTQVSIFAIGISPYITAQIIVQLLSSDLIPPLARMAKSGERGRKKMEVVTRLLTLPFAGIQAYAILTMATSAQRGFVHFASNLPFAVGSPAYYFFYIALMIAGTYIAIFLGDLITKRGVGNGITLIILSGIIASLFSSFQTVFIVLKAITGQSAQLVSIISFIVYVCFYIIVLLSVVFINGSVRKIPIQQVGQALSKNEDELSYLPIKINSAGVIPVIFASSLMTIPSTVAQFLPEGSAGALWIRQYMVLNSISGLIIYFFLIILFTFFYSYIQINPNKISEDFKKSGRFIPGVKMGRDTEQHISRTLFRVNWIGGPFLALIAALPYIVSIVSNHASGGVINIPSYAALGGTGIVIMVSATIELWSSIKSTATTTSYTYQRKEIEASLSATISNETVNDNDDSQLW
ncbi:preprotein translocase subunit SecY [Ureaplasma ceti]|uniref:Protein translocase subunit SecY n=1 Tax=Ureaplasma ceti TaxID=3119530 RepID=A0ABP9U550_9BACT